MSTSSHISTLVGCLAVLVASQAMAVEGVTSVKVAAPIVIDGASEAAWEQAAPMKLTLDKTPYKPEGFAGITQTEITMRSAYDAENVYFLVQYKDPTRSLARFP
jgi:hypothetical protein